jgi:hypothetical protein
VRDRAARAGLLALFGALSAGGYRLAARAGPPATPEPGDVVLLGAATFKLSRLLTKAKATQVVREPFVDSVAPGADGEVNAEPVRDEGVRSVVGELLTCPFCMSVWVATALVLLYVRSPRLARLVASGLAVVAVADVTQHLDAAVRRVDEG